MSGRAGGTRRGLLARVVGLAAASALLHAACGSTDRSGPAGEPGGSQSQGKVTFSFWGDTTYWDINQKILDAFAAQNTRVQVELLQFPDDYRGKILALYAGGASPDTLWVDMNDVQFTIARGMLAEQGSLGRRDRDFKAEEYEDVDLEHLRDAKGVLYGYPWGKTSSVMYYNVDLFRTAGLQLPYDLWRADAWTWEAYFDAAQRLTKRGADAASSVIGGHQFERKLWMWTAGGEEYDHPLHPKRCLYDSPEAIEGIQFFVDLLHKHRVAYTRDETGMSTDDAFINGRIAITWGYQTRGPIFRKEITERNRFKWDVVPFPKRKVYAGDRAGRHPVALSTQSRLPDAAWTWIKWINGPEGHRIRSQDAGVNSPRRPYFRLAVANLPAEHPEVFLDAQRYGKLRLLAINSFDIHAIVNRELAPAESGQEAVAPLARQAAAAANRYLAENPQ
jgi:multiple sugar transport system substrate-binding protein